MTSRATAAAALLAATAFATAMAGCSSTPPKKTEQAPVDPRAAGLAQGFGTMDRLVEAARKEGALNLVGVPRDWVNYGAVIDRFTGEYGLRVNVIEPGASSRREIDLAAAAKTADRTPDVFDVGVDVAVASAQRFAPYKVTAWQDIPDAVKDLKGLWYAGYGGYMSIGYDPRKVAAPARFADLLKPGYAVALPGDPLRTAAAFNAVMAASLQDGRPQAERGLALFGRLKKEGRLSLPSQANALVDWDYVNAAKAAQTAGDDKPAWKVVVPPDAALASYYVQAINKKAPHPAAARLWEEFLYSDEVQNLFLKGFARPARMEAMEMSGTLDRQAAAKLPAVPRTPVLLTIPQADEAKTYLKANWARTMG
ncbi:ABC transporter substrate-binding protein [Sphaerisporangium melleum]|uniref:ABC transporter substrate-binding protein n=1 Tax=Sphaerisporangium melleum TaxID=321316 RepID=A0A917VF05_9ACTN|nr:ABC transporter substrate-binding protein [Sphaerisporangium melleum]GGK68029.1 ABC transporter substrate-binding protein [Sphaerisporangium melleum]GII68846.1 ABC transporter substrate-binding protein [Sphaerisporangium melleum]